MIAISLKFLAGRFHATPWGHHVNEGVVEWPPSPWRLLRSLVAVFHRARPAGVTEAQLENIVTRLSKELPVFSLPPATTAHTRHYDQDNGGVKFFDTFVAVAQTEQVLCYWRETELNADDTAALSALLTALNTLGRSESWCEATLLSDLPSGTFNSEPYQAGQSLMKRETMKLLMPDADRANIYEVLKVETSAMRKAKMLEPEGTRWVTYVRPSDAFAIKQKRSSPRKAPDVQVARFALDANVLPLIQSSLPFAERFRSELLAHRRRLGTYSKVLTGKEQSDGTPLTGHDHAHFIPTDEDGDGRLDHLTVYAERGFDHDDLAALGALLKVRQFDDRRPDIQTVMIGLGKKEQFAELAIFNPKKFHRWRSVTPFSLPRFANRGGGKPPRPRDLPEAQLRRELKSRGWPEPISIKRTEGHSVNDRPLVRWLEFHARRFNGTEGYGLAGFEIEFDEPQAGPIALGFGCHFGLGLFLPIA